MPEHSEQVKAAIDSFCAAWAEGDGARLGAGFVEDGTLINPFGQRADGRDAIGAMYSEFFNGLLGDTTTTYELASVRPIGDDHAFVDGDQTVKAPDGSVVLVVHLAALMRRDGDSWRFADARPYVYATPPQ
jgi:uncharacterized protein (TIGR02246 family)